MPFGAQPGRREICYLPTLSAFTLLGRNLSVPGSTATSLLLSKQPHLQFGMCLRWQPHKGRVTEYCTEGVAGGAAWQYLPFIDIQLPLPLLVPPDKSQHLCVRRLQADLGEYTFYIHCLERGPLFLSLMLTLELQLFHSIRVPLKLYPVILYPSLSSDACSISDVPRRCL